MLLCAASFVVAAYVAIRLSPQGLRALPEPAPAKTFGSFAEDAPGAAISDLFTTLSNLTAS
jgi:hypothetical protein